MHGISALKEVPQGSLAPFTMWGQSEGTSRGPKVDLHHSASTLTLDFPGLRTVRNEFLLFLSYPVYGVLLEKPEWDNPKKEEIDKLERSKVKTSL